MPCPCLSLPCRSSSGRGDITGLHLCARPSRLLQRQRQQQRRRPAGRPVARRQRNDHDDASPFLACLQPIISPSHLRPCCTYLVQVRPTSPVHGRPRRRAQPTRLIARRRRPRARRRHQRCRPLLRASRLSPAPGPGPLISRLAGRAAGGPTLSASRSSSAARGETPSGSTR